MGAQSKNRCDRCFRKAKRMARYRLPRGIILYQLYKAVCKSCYIELVKKEPDESRKLRTKGKLFRKYALV